MSQQGIDIKYKCPKNSKKGTKSTSSRIQCRHSGFTASLRELYYKEYPYYKECKHYPGTYLIKNLKYSGEDLKDENGYTNLIDENDRVQEVSTYYADEYDNDKEIKKPLLLRIKYETGEKWYSNADADKEEQDEEGEEEKLPANTRWRNIDGSKFYSGLTPTPTFKSELDKLTCKLHNLHHVDISKGATYSCPVCGKYTVTVTIEPEKNGVKEYIKYRHYYTTNPDSVRYDNTDLEWRHEGSGDYDKTFLLDKNTPHLTVYYLDVDKSRRRIPLLMEVTTFGTEVLVCNSGIKDNSKWSMIMPKTPSDNGFKLPPEELKEKLQEIRSKLFQSAEIDVTKDNHPNQYYNGEESPDEGQGPSSDEEEEGNDPSSEVEAIVELGEELLEAIDPFIELGLAGSAIASAFGPAAVGTALQLANKIICPANKSLEAEPSPDLSDQVPDTESETKILLQGTPVEEMDSNKNGGQHFLPLELDGFPGLTVTDVTEASEEAALPFQPVHSEGYPIHSVSIDPLLLTPAVQGSPIVEVPTVYLDSPPLPISTTGFPVVGGYRDSATLASQEGGFAPQSLPEEQVARSSAPFGFIGGSNLKYTTEETERELYSVGIDAPFTFTTQVAEASAQPQTSVQQAVAQAQKVSDPIPGSLPRETPPDHHDSNNPFWTIEKTIPTVSSVLGTSALACFAGWKLYNRYKGDPWVRDGYPHL